MIMNWHKYLYEAWRDFYEKKKNNGEESVPHLYSFAQNYKTRIAVVERHLRRKDYCFGKWKAILIPKKDGSDRPLIIPNSISDKLVLKAISGYLSSTWFYLFNSVSSISYAYQKGRSTRDALIQLKKIHNPKNILLKIDIKHFFDEIDKTILTQLLEQYPIDDYVKELICKGINPTIDFSSLKKSDMNKFPQGGIPQGNPISAVLSNLYLYELDKLSISKKWKMVRYADDMVFSVSDIEEAQMILYQIENYLSENRNLTIHPLSWSKDAKTTIVLNPKENKMKYLGIDFDGQYLFPTEDCCYKLIGEIKNILKSTSTSEEKEIAIKKAISQWCGYYAFTDISNKRMKRMDKSINYQIQKHKLNIRTATMIDVISKTRKRQNSRINKIFNFTKFGIEYNWLNIYG